MSKANECGCKIVRPEPHSTILPCKTDKCAREWHASVIEFCPLHKEAKNLLDALKDLLYQIETNGERQDFVTGKALHAIGEASKWCLE